MSDTKIKDLTAATAALSTHDFPVNEATNDRRVTGAQLRTFVRKPTLPTIVNVGALFHSTGVPTATIGTTQTDDIVLLLLHSSNDSQVAAPTNYQQIGPQNGIGAAATAGSVKGCAFWKRAVGVESAPTIPDTGDHTAGVIIIIRGCRNTGRPFFLGGVNWKFATSTSATGCKSQTWVDNTLVMDIFFQAIDTAGAQASAAANTDLANVTEQFDDSTTDGTGGGIAVITGEMASAGSVKATTLTWAATTVDVSLRLQFLPADADYAVHGAFPDEVWDYIGSPADLDDAFIKPNGMKRCHVQVCDGGGSGSSGNTTTTAEGGGGGGGGGYDEAWYGADDLSLSTTVHAGKGGAAVVGLNNAGNPGVLSEFDKGGQGPLTSARRIAGTAATAAASAAGGKGGCGSGRGTASPAVSARIDLTAATAGAALGGVGGRGGNGTTTAVGGSPADWGGGGGENGSDTDVSTAAANNGWSVRGGGGGGGGRTNTNIGQGAFGGGAAAPANTQGQNGVDSTRFPYGGSGACGGGSATPAGGTGGFPGGAGGGGGGVTNGNGGAGGHGAVRVTAVF